MPTSRCRTQAKKMCDARLRYLEQLCERPLAEPVRKALLKCLRSVEESVTEITTKCRAPSQSDPGIVFRPTRRSRQGDRPHG